MNTFLLLINFIKYLKMCIRDRYGSVSASPCLLSIFLIYLKLITPHKPTNVTFISPNLFSNRQFLVFSLSFCITKHLPWSLYTLFICVDKYLKTSSASHHIFIIHKKKSNQIILIFIKLLILFQCVRAISAVLKVIWIKNMAMSGKNYLRRWERKMLRIYDPVKVGNT